MVPRKSTPGKFAYNRHFQRTGINATKFEKTPVHFKSDVFAAVAVVDAKSPYSLPLRSEYLFYILHHGVAQKLYDMWRPTVEIGAAQIRCVREITLKSPFWATWKAILYSLNSNGTELEQVVDTLRTSRRSGWRRFNYRELKHQTFFVPQTPTASIFAAWQPLRTSRHQRFKFWVLRRVFVIQK